MWCAQHCLNCCNRRGGCTSTLAVNQQKCGALEQQERQGLDRVSGTWCRCLPKVAHLDDGVLGQPKVLLGSLLCILRQVWANIIVSRCSVVLAGLVLVLVLRCGAAHAVADARVCVLEVRQLSQHAPDARASQRHGSSKVQKMTHHGLYWTECIAHVGRR